MACRGAAKEERASEVVTVTRLMFCEKSSQLSGESYVYVTLFTSLVMMMYVCTHSSFPLTTLA